MLVSKPRNPHLFGSRLRDRLLSVLALIPEIHIRGAAAALDATPSEAAKAVASLERIGVVVSRRAAGARLVSLNPRWYAAVELRRLLTRLAEADAELLGFAEGRRVRPRRTGKPL